MSNTIKVVVLSTLFLSAATASAAVPRIIHQAAAEEAERIEVRFIPGENGVATVNGCTRCPLQLTVDAKARFFFRDKPVPHAKVMTLSGGSGTVIHDKGAVIRIRWDTDAAGNK